MVGVRVMGWTVKGMSTKTIQLHPDPSLPLHPRQKGLTVEGDEIRGLSIELLIRQTGDPLHIPFLPTLRGRHLIWGREEEGRGGEERGAWRSGSLEGGLPDQRTA